MIKFFRKIRQQLISENKSDRASRTGVFSSYLLYAFGEIILVVFGILIALQINNWNNDRQNRIKEKGILEELKSGLLKDKALLEETLGRYESDFVQLNHLDSLLKVPSYPYTENLNVLFGKVYGIRFLRLNNAFYEDLKSTGLQIIQSKKLRSEIVLLFESKYKLLQGYLESEKSPMEVIRPSYLANFTNIDFHDAASPIDFQKIWRDPYFKNIVHYRIITLKYNQLTEYPSTIARIDQIVTEIDNYSAGN